MRIVGRCSAAVIRCNHGIVRACARCKQPYFGHTVWGLVDPGSLTISGKWFERDVVGACDRSKENIFWYTVWGLVAPGSLIVVRR